MRKRVSYITEKICTLALTNAVAIFVFICIVNTGIGDTGDNSQNINPSTERESFLHSSNLSLQYYRKNDDISRLFTKLEQTHPNLAHKYNIGNTVQGRKMYVLRLGLRNSDNSSNVRDLLKPMIKVTSNIHGDEAVGREMILFLAEYLLENYETLPEVQSLLNTTELHLLPSCNPDGFEAAKEGNCESLANYVGRTNAAGVDLNRDFPDRLESQHLIQLRSQSRQPETAALVEWILSKPFVLSANFHGGAVVASYPYDNSIAHRDCCEQSLTPDDHVFKLLAHSYADNNPVMHRGSNCNDTFTDGITNGANWYELNGGMQDFNYAFSNCFELTIELSCCKYPKAEALPDEWINNKRSLIQLIKMAHIGVKGLVKDASGYPIHDATIIVSGLEDKPVRTTRRGEYWRLLTPGIYYIQALAFGYQPSSPQQIHVTNNNSEALQLDFTLTPIEANYDGSFRKMKEIREKPAEENDGFLTATKFEHHNYFKMEKFIKNIADSYPTITRLYSIGKSVENRELWVLEVFAHPGIHIPGIPEFKYVANMHGNEVIGKEMLLLLTKYLCEHYMIDTRITNMINTTRIHFLYSMNPDGYERAHEGDKSGAQGRSNANNIDLNRNFPDQYGTDKYNYHTEPEVLAVMNWTLSLPFVLSANLHGGSLVANYPFDDNENDFTSIDIATRLRAPNVKGRKVNPTEDNELFKHLALVYSEAHPTMHLGEPCPMFKNEIFPQGITNGAEWYSVTGGMQDWNYIRAGVLELTIEMGCDKFPMTSELPKYWQDNRESLLLFIEQVHNGVHGIVRSSISSPISGAMLSLDGAKHATYSGTYGDYYKLALPGRHNVTILADGFSPQRQEIEIPTHGKRSVTLDITMMRDDPQHWASANDYRIIANVVNTRYHNDAELRELLAEYETENGQIATFGYADNEFGLYFNSIKLTADIGEPEETKYKILVMSSFFDSVASLGREITMNLIRHIIEGYKIREPKILHLLQHSIIHFIPITEKFENAFRLYNKNNSICDPVFGNELANRILSPENEKRRDLLLTFLENEKFNLMLTFGAGHSDITYPKSNNIYKKFARNIENTEFSFPPLLCETTSSRTLQHSENERLTNLFYKIYNIPTFTIGLSCCRMPIQNEIASIWRKNLDRIKNFFNLIKTGVAGVIQNNGNEPIRSAVVRIIDNNLEYNVTKNIARFQIILPEGIYALEISAPNYESRVEKLNITAGIINDLGVLKLNKMALISGESAIHEMGIFSTDSVITVTGFVLDINSHPINHAKVSIVSPLTKYYLRNFTDSMGNFIIRQVPAKGEIEIQVEAPRHMTSTRRISIDNVNQIVGGIIFRLEKDEKVLGMSRIVFIIIASILIILGVVLLVLFAQYFCAHRYKQGTDRRYYNFSLLKQKSKELFDDDLGEDGETELFRSPIKKGMSIQPYFDDENVEIIEDSDDEVFHNDSGDEIVMLEKRSLVK